MARRRKKITPVEVGDIIVMREWSGAQVSVKVHKTGESKGYGPTVEGVVVELVEGVWRSQYFTALPLSRRIEVARVRTEGRGKWVIEYADGTEERAKSKKAAQDICTERGVVFQEVL